MDCHIERCHDRVGGGMFVLDESGKDPILVIESKVDGHKLFLLVHYLFFLRQYFCEQKPKFIVTRLVTDFILGNTSTHIAS